MPLEITAARPDPALLDLPWEIPLEEWPADNLVALPRGISRHVVRFVRMSGRVIAIKEIGELARREYELLRLLTGSTLPCVSPVGSRQRARRPRRRAARRAPHHPAPAVLAALSRAVQPGTAPGHRPAAGRRARRAARPPAPGRLLLGRRVPVQHAVPTRRRAPSRRTSSTPRRATCRPALDGQREYDLELARMNIVGELMDLQAGELLEDVVRPGRDRPRSSSATARSGAS